MMRGVHFLKDEGRVLAVSERERLEVAAPDVREAAAFVVRASLSEREARERQVGALHLKREAEGFTLRLSPHTPPVQVDVSSAVCWWRSLDEVPFGWDVQGQHVTLQVCGVTVWNAGPQTAATLGVALALTLEHPGVFFGAGAPFPSALPTALLPGSGLGTPGLRVAAYTARRFGLHLQEVGRVPFTGSEYLTLQRQLLGLLRALTLEQPGAVPALRTLEALLGERATSRTIGAPADRQGGTS